MLHTTVSTNFEWLEKVAWGGFKAVWGLVGESVQASEFDNGARVMKRRPGA